MNGNFFHRISELEEKVAKLEEDNGPRNELAILKMSLEELCLTRDSMLKQKARVDWLKEGDINTKKFHQVIQKRRARNSIKKLICLISQKNSRLEADFLERPVVIEEVELALNQSGLDKAPGPDGLNAGEIPSGMNSSFISLIPKLEFPLGMGDFRPISLV
ncbi:hypothetical protein POM88_040817 [Heracleum sosnowskyi]|uniref:RNA-directed DNA polymerase (Reverse transcriptase) n=1 Tax=Heracleum sosnowskyi TaxID=360622 RepID=A0AAD8HDV3_9APIA|nr:hypothetical protein POM88_040817 [Heracleum sosnowskyi]